MAILGIRQAKTYSSEQVELFPWYTYLFLGRGKPTTHLAALRLIDDATLAKGLPPILKRLIKRISLTMGVSGEEPNSNGEA